MIPLVPGDVRPFVLESGRQDIVWKFRALSVREAIAPTETYEQLIEQGNSYNTAMMQKTLEALSVGLVDWEAPEKLGDFEISKLPDILTRTELFELLTVVVFEHKLNTEEKKTSNRSVDPDRQAV